MSGNDILVDELRDTMARIRAIHAELGQMNQKAAALHQELQTLEGARQRIEVDLTTKKLEVI